MFQRNCCNRNMFNQNMAFQNPCMEECVVEPTITKCVEKEIYHEVPHVC